MPDQTKTIATPINNAMCDFFISMSWSCSSSIESPRITRKDANNSKGARPFDLSVHSRLAGSLLFLHQFNRQIDRGNHAIGFRDSFPRDFKRGAVIGTGAGERQAERRVHAVMKRVQFERDQSLIVIHAKHGVEFAFDRAVENGVGGSRTRKTQ